MFETRFLSTKSSFKFVSRVVTSQRLFYGIKRREMFILKLSRIQIPLNYKKYNLIFFFFYNLK